MPSVSLHFGACVYNGRIYAIGGNDDEYDNAELYVYNPGGESTLVNDINPVGFELAQNHPNPFNPSTTITYRLEKPGMVNLIIYDMLGRKVETLVDEVKLPGSYSVLWNGKGYASGVYFYRLETGGVEGFTQKMMLVK